MSNRKASLAALVLAGGIALSGLLLPQRARLAHSPEAPASAASSASPLGAHDSAGLDCGQARIVVKEVRERLAAVVPALDDEL